MNYFISVLKNYAKFDGRARRAEYWYFTLFSTLISVLLSIVVYTSGVMYLDSIYSLAVFIPSLAVGVRRMHDVGKSGWYLLIPIYNLILACTPGEVGSNQYGEDPKGSDINFDEFGVKEKDQNFESSLN